MRVPMAGGKAANASTTTSSVGGKSCDAVGLASRTVESLVMCEAMFPDLPLLDVNLRTGAKGADVARALLKRWGVP